MGKTLDDGNIHVQNKHASVVHLFSLNNFSSLQPPFYCPRYYFLAHTIFTSIRPIDDIETLPTSATTRVRTHCRSTCADNDLNCTRRGRGQALLPSGASQHKIISAHRHTTHLPPPREPRNSTGCQRKRFLKWVSLSSKR